MSDRSISLSLTARVTGLVSGLRNGREAVDGFASRVARFARENEEHLDRVGKASLLMGGALAAGFVLSVKSAMEFDSAMSEVRASTHETAGNMELLRDAAVVAGADTAFSAVEAAKGIDELAKAGVSTKDILAGGLTGALSLAAAGSLGVGDAAEIAASALTQFKLSGKDIPHLADLLAAGAGKAQGSVEDMGAALNQAGLVSASTGLSIEETTGGLAAFASAGLVGSDAGTSFKSMLQRLTPQSLEAKNKMTELGISAYDAQGEFIGLSKFSENLKTSMQDLTPEARNAAMGVIFGSDAVRAANVLYEQGGKGIQEWTDNVNEAGYAAVTASIKQDNLAGDLEKLGGSFDTVLIKGGSAAAESLRGVVQTAEDLVDAIGKIPEPVLNTAVGIAGIAGGALLLGGSVLTLLPKLVEFGGSFNRLATAAPRVATGLSRVGKAAGIAAGALIAFEIFNAVAYDKRVHSTEEIANALLKVNKASTGGGIAALDSQLSDFGNFAGRKIAPDINSAADAIARITHPESSDGINRWADQAFGWTGLAKSATTQVDDNLAQIGNEMGNLVKNGGADAAAKSFAKLSDEFVKNGSSAQDALDHLPGYKDALLALGQQSGVALEGQDLLDAAMGRLPKSMQMAAGATETYTSAAGEVAPVSEEMAKSLEDIGLSASGAVTDIDAFAKSLFAAGLLSLSSSDAAIAYQDSIDKMTESITTNGTTLDISTEKGRANQSAFNGIASAAMATAEATASETLASQGSAAAQAELQTALRTSYDDLVTAAGQLGITGDAADAMARKALGIPKEIPIDTWVNDNATGSLDAIKGRADALDGRFVSMTIETINRQVNQSEYKDDPSMVALDPALNARGGRVNYLAGGGRPRLYDMQPRGTDTIPTMLTPNEMVLNTKASASLGYGNLDAANKGNYAPLALRMSAAPAPLPQAAAHESSNGPSINLGGIKIYGATDAQAVTRQVIDEITFKLGAQGVRVG